jgi:5-methylcytosine-specific restriction endonuclease McrA
MRRCSVCGGDGPFYERSNYCKPCHIAYTGARARAKLVAETAEEREARLALRRLKRHGRSERVKHPRTPEEREALSKARARAYYEAHREERIAQVAARRNADPEAARAYERAVYERRRAKHQAANRARERRLEKPDRETLEYDVILRADPCSFCGTSGVQVDHIDAVAHGGRNHWSNLTAACRPCNRAKSDKSLLAFMGGV